MSLISGRANEDEAIAPTAVTAKSLKFKTGNFNFLQFNPTNSGSKTTWTWSGWVKRSKIGAIQTFLSCYNGTNNNDSFSFDASDRLSLYLVSAGGVVRASNAVFRDTAAWYHVVIALDTTNPTASSRIRAWVNNVEVTSWATNATITQNAEFLVNTSSLMHCIGRYYPQDGNGGYFDGNIAEVTFVDGTVVDPSFFAEYNAVSGQWLPKMPPNIAADGDSYWNKTTLLARTDLQKVALGDLTIYDEVYNRPVYTYGNAAGTGTMSKYNPAMSFDGYNSCVSVDNHVGLRFGTGDFTAELWIYPTAITSEVTLIRNGWLSGTTTSGSWDLNLQPTKKIGFYWDYYSSSQLITTSNTVTFNQWNHIAVTRSGTTVQIFINGVLGATNTISTDFSAVGGVHIGGVPVDQYWSNVSFMINNEVNWNDIASSIPGSGFGSVTCAPWARLNGTAGLAIGSVSNTFPGATGYVAYNPGAYFALGTGDFTVELWFNVQAAYGNVAGTAALIDNYNAYGSDGNFRLLLSHDAVGNVTNITWSNFNTTTGWKSNSVAISLSVNTWNHIALVRSNNVCSIYVNGVNQHVTDNIGSSNVYQPPQGWWLGATPAGGNQFQGYIDNLRVTKGIARYTADFIASTNPFPTTGPIVSSVGDPNWGSVVLLMHGDGADNGTVITDETGKTITVSGNTVTKTAVKKFGSSSMYFDGTGDYFTVPYSTDFTFTGDVTIEFWIYPTDVSVTRYLMYSPGSDPILAWINDSGAPGKLGFWFRSGTLLNSTTTILANTWYHVAYVRQGTTGKLYINGVMEASGGGGSMNATSSLGSATSSFGFAGGYGGLGAASTNLYKGYLDEFRITKGVARYTSNFTPATAAYPTYDIVSDDPYWKKVTLLCHFEGSNGAYASTTTDSSLSAHTFSYDTTAYSAIPIISTTRSKIGSSSFYGAAGRPLQVLGTQSDFDVGAGDFTLECWINVTATSGGQQTIFCHSNFATVTDCMQLYISSGAAPMTLNFQARTSTALDFMTLSSNIQLNTWYHVAISRVGASMYGFIDGALVKTISVGTHSYNTSPETWIGGISTSYPLSGYIDELRFTKGVGRYSVSFTPNVTQFSGTTVYPSFMGYIDEVRFTKGLARYTTSFTSLPASIPHDFTNVPASAVFMLYSDGAASSTAITDVRGHPLSVGSGCMLSTAQKKFGMSSVSFNGTQFGTITTPYSGDFAFGSGDFTIETWVYLNNFNSASPIASLWYNGTPVYCGWTCDVNQSGFMSLAFYSGTAYYLITAGTAMSAGTWNHVAYVRSNGDVKLFLNGVQVGGQLGTPAINAGTNSMMIGGRVGDYSSFLNGYIDDLRISKSAVYTSNFVPTTSAFSPVIVPYGPNGYHLSFNDGANTGTLGLDSSGRYNAWSLGFFSLTPGVDYCWSSDHPTNNFASLGSLEADQSVTNGGLTVSGATKAVRTSVGGYGNMTFYVEFYIDNPGYISTQRTLIGLTDLNSTATFSKGNWMCISSSGSLLDSSGTNVTVPSFSMGDTISVTINCSAGQMKWAKNGVDFITTTTSPYYTMYIPTVYTGADANTAVTVNCGQIPYNYGNPLMSKRLCASSLPTPVVPVSSAQVQVKLDTGANIKTNCESVFPSQFLEIVKDRVNANNWQVIDSARGATSVLRTNTTDGESTYTAPSGTSVGYVFKAASEVQNTYGSITSQVSANTTSKFSIVRYTGTGTVGTIGHGLGATPQAIIVKNKTTSNTPWSVYHHEMVDFAGSFYKLRLNSQNSMEFTTNWNMTNPTDNVFSVSAEADVNMQNSQFVAYCFREVIGYSKIGSYIGNGVSNGPFVWCGFSPKFILIKSRDTSDAWDIVDTSRNLNNVANTYSTMSTNAAELSTSGGWDIVSNGFKVRGINSNLNASGSSYIFIAFAEWPFNYANAR